MKSSASQSSSSGWLAGTSSAKIVGRFEQSQAQVALPEPIDDRSGEPRICRIGDPARRAVQSHGSVFRNRSSARRANSNGKRAGTYWPLCASQRMRSRSCGSEQPGEAEKPVLRPFGRSRNDRGNWHTSSPCPEKPGRRWRPFAASGVIFVADVFDRVLDAENVLLSRPSCGRAWPGRAVRRPSRRYGRLCSKLCRIQSR